MPKYRNITTDKGKKNLLIVTLFAYYFFETTRFNFCIFRLCEKILPKNLCKVYPTVKRLHSLLTQFFAPSRHPERVSRSPEKSEGEGSPSFDKEWILQATPSE